MYDQVRDLLYFLYDYKFFESYDIHNESSIVFRKRRDSLNNQQNSSAYSSVNSSLTHHLDESIKNEASIIFS